MTEEHSQVIASRRTHTLEATNPAPFSQQVMRMNELIRPAAFAPASTITNRAVKWAIDDHVALEDVTLFAGPRKSGKSLMMAHIVACFTNGRPFAPGLFVNKEAQGAALLYNGERAKESFASPRCAAAGANMEKVYIRDQLYSLADIIADIRQAPPNIRFIGIDPLKAFADAAHAPDKVVRQLIDELAYIARERSAAIVLMHHITLRGRHSEDPTDYIQGKRVWIESPLCAWILCGLSNGFVMEQVASNKVAGQKYEYVIESHRLPDGVTTERVEVLGTSQHSVIDALNGQSRFMGVKTKRQRALDWLRAYLAEGPRLRNEIYKDGSAARHSKATLMRAKQDGRIEDHKRSGDGQSEWSLPGTAKAGDSCEPVESVESVVEGCSGDAGHWWTPKHVMDAIHEQFGPCDLDPASPAKPVHVQANKWFTKEQDGLKQSWLISKSGWLFLNCPWSATPGEPRPIPLWTDKLLIVMSCGDVPRAITLLPLKSSAPFDKLKRAGAAIINLGRLKFGGEPSTSYDDTACCLIGFTKAQVDELATTFRRHGCKRADIERYGES